jgi:AraC-like DNA-binding protein
MQSNSFFRLVDEIGHDPRLPVARPKVFPNTRGLRFDPVERPWARWEGGTLGDSGIELRRVRSTGHSIDLVGASRWSYHLPLRGDMALTFGREETAYRAGDGLLLGARQRRTHVLPVGSGLFDGIVLLFDPAGAGLVRPALRDSEVGLVTARDRGALAAYLRFLSVELAGTASSVHAPAALQAAGALLKELIAATASATGGHGDRGAAPVGLFHVRRAEEVMRARFAEPLTIPALAAEVGAGPRALQAAFATHRKASPRAVLTAMRLDAARDALLSAREAETVTGIALACGFAHLGRFARAYAERFGEAPSQTLSRARPDRMSRA